MRALILLAALAALPVHAEEQFTCDQLASLASRLSVMSRYEPPAILENKLLDYLKETHRSRDIEFITQHVLAPIQAGPTGSSALAVQVKRICEEWSGTI